MDDADFMRRAIALSCESVESGGGPFGAVVVHKGKIIGEGVNQVVPAADPTAHAEIVAIRAACRTLGSHALERAAIYTSCEPCPMCLAAIYWARLSRIVYGNSRSDAAAIGFDDDAIYREVAVPIEDRKIPQERLMADEARQAFDVWERKADRLSY